MPPVVPVEKFAAGVVDTGGKFAISVVVPVLLIYGWCNFTCDHREFLKKSEMNLMLISRAWGKMAHINCSGIVIEDDLV